MPEYFHYILDGVEPEMKERRDIGKIMELLTTLQEQMTLAPGAKPTKAGSGSPAQDDAEIDEGGVGARGIITLPVPYGASPLDEPGRASFSAQSVFPGSGIAANGGDDGRIPVPYNVSIRNMGDGAVRIIGKKWTVRSHQDGTQVIGGG